MDYCHARGSPEKGVNDYLMGWLGVLCWRAFLHCFVQGKYFLSAGLVIRYVVRLYRPVHTSEK